VILVYFKALSHYLSGGGRAQEKKTKKVDFLDPEDRCSKLLQNISTALNTSNAEYQQSHAVEVHAVNHYDIPLLRWFPKMECLLAGVRGDLRY